MLTTKTNPSFKSVSEQPSRTFEKGKDTSQKQENSHENAVKDKNTEGSHHDFSRIPVFADNKIFIQPKLTINTPGDVYEQEADRMAERVMNLSDTSTASNLHISQKNDAIQRKGENRGGLEASSSLVSQLNTTKGGGSPLPEGTRSFMQNAFGNDFQGVRVHRDSRAREMSQGIQAKAFTHGQDIYFNDGEYAPESGEGKRLLAHELTHVRQQTGINKRIQRDEAADKAAADEAKKKAALITKIKTHGFIAVEDAGATFTSAELDLVDKAMAKLPAADKATIKGAKLVRVSSLGPSTAGRYSNEQGYNDTTPTDEQKIELSDRAFGATSADESIRVIIHEVGHAIAAMPYRVAMSDEVKAGVKFNQSVNDANVAIGAFNDANDESNAAVDVSNAAVDVYNTAINGTDKAAIAAAKKDMDAKKAITAKLKAARAAKETVSKSKSAASDAQKTVLTAKAATSATKIAKIDDFKTDAAAKLTVMQTAYTAVETTIKAVDAESADYKAALTATQDAIKTFYDENVTIDVGVEVAEAAKSVVDTAISDRNSKKTALDSKNAKNTVTSAMTPLEAAQDSCFKAAVMVAFNKSLNLSVRKFYDFVIANGISPNLTPYAADNWPHKPEEFYAEAYSFFITKPTDLEKYSKQLFDWFKAGNYK